MDSASFEIQQSALRLMAEGKPQEAIPLLESYLEDHPGQNQARLQLAMAYVKLGQLEKAISHFYRFLQYTAPELTIASEIVQVVEKTITLFLKNTPSPSIQTIGHIAYCFDRLDRRKEAGALYNQLLSMCKGQARVPLLLQLVERSLDIHMPEEAIRYAREAVSLSPENHLAYHYLGRSLAYSGLWEEAKAAFEEVLLRKPDYLDAHRALCASYESLGDFTALDAAALRGLERLPDNPYLYFILARTHKYRSIKEDIPQRMLALAQQVEEEKVLFEPDARVHFHFGLGKVLNDAGEYEQAFRQYALGNDIKYRLMGGFPIERFRASIDHHIATLTPAFFKEKAALYAGNPSEVPIFIVGMPRSGTTLVEQIISSHPKVGRAGELKTLPDIVHRIALSEGVKTSEDMIAHLTAEKIAVYAEEYLESLYAKVGIYRDRSSECVRITDKMPFNFEYLWLAAVLFPNAKVIDCRRNPYDTILSNYFQIFRKGNAYAYNLEAAAHYYVGYDRLMAYWQKVLPLPIYQVEYEALVADPGKEIPKLIEFTGLSWDVACLTPEKNEAPVQTLSNWQVRQPIYKGSLEQWRRYEHELAPVRKVIEEAGIG